MLTHLYSLAGTSVRPDPSPASTPRPAPLGKGQEPSGDSLTTPHCRWLQPQELAQEVALRGTGPQAGEGLPPHGGTRPAVGSEEDGVLEDLRVRVWGAGSCWTSLSSHW